MAAGLLLSWLSEAAAAPPGSVTDAPRIDDTVRPLSEVLEVLPGATCLTHETLLEGLAAWREGSMVDRRLTIAVEGDPDDPHAARFEVRVSGELAVERQFERAPKACADLHAVVGLAIAIALDDTLANELGIAPPQPLGPAEQVEPGEGDLPTFDDRRPPRPPAGRPRMGVAAVGGLFAGITPRLSAGGQLAFDIWPTDHFDVRIGGLATHLPSFQLGDGRVATTVAAGRLDLCWGTAPLSVRLRLCGGFAGGASIASGDGFATDQRQTAPWLAGIAGVDVLAHLTGRLSLEFRVEGVFPVQRTQLEVRGEDGQSLFTERLSVAGVVVSVGPRFEF